jgi:hypothetical protein
MDSLSEGTLSMMGDEIQTQVIEKGMMVTSRGNLKE